MRLASWSMILAAFLAQSQPAHAQIDVDVSGHWEGAVETPTGSMLVVFDLARDEKGALSGTFSQPSQDIYGLPLRSVVLDDQAITITARDDQPFSGIVAPDRRSIAGRLSARGYEFPVTLVWTGEPKIEPPSTSPAVDKSIEGAWNGTTGDGSFILNIVNRPDGLAAAELVNLTEGRLRIPVAQITVDGGHLTLDLKAIGGSYQADLNAGGTELSGIYTQGQVHQPITFRKAN